MIKTEICTDLNEYEAFVSRHHNGHFLQSLGWAQLKTHWDSLFIVARDERGVICGAAAALSRKITGLPYSLMVVARGPVCDSQDAETYTVLIETLRKIAKEKHCYCLSFEPDIGGDDEKRISLLNNLGFVQSRRNLTYQGLHPHILWRKKIDGMDHQTLIDSFGSKTRYNVRYAMKNNVSVCKGTAEDIPAWFEILKQTGRRDNFLVRTEEYYEKMAETMGEHFHLYMAYFNQKVAAGIIVISYAQKSWYLYGATSDMCRECKASHLLQYEAMCDAIDRGDKLYDFRGISGYMDENHPLYGIYRFKKGFGGEVVMLAGRMDFVLNRPIYALAELFMKIRSKGWVHRSALQPSRRKRISLLKV